MRVTLNISVFFLPLRLHFLFFLEVWNLVPLTRCQTRVKVTGIDSTSALVYTTKKGDSVASKT